MKRFAIEHWTLGLFTAISLILAPAAAAETASLQNQNDGARQRVEFGLDATVGPLLEARAQVLFPWTVVGAKLGVEIMGSPKSAPYWGAQLGAGVRAEWRLSFSESNALLISPGVAWKRVFRDPSASKEWEFPFFIGPLDNINLISPGLDIAWRHAYSPRFALVLGGRFGETFSLGGRDGTWHQTRGEVEPVAGGFIGVRF